MSVLAGGPGGTRGDRLPPGAAQPPGQPARPPPPAPAGRAALTGAPRSPGDVPMRRRWGRFAAGTGLALLGGLLFAVLYLSAGSRVEVLVAARDISPYETIEREDLRVERVAADPDVATIAAANLDAIVGRVAAASLPAGALIAPDQVFAADAEIVAPSEAIVGLVLDRGDAPVSLATGDEVQVAIDPGPGDQAPQAVPGWVLELGERDDVSGDRTASVVVPASSALAVGNAAADGRVSLFVTRSG